jgi:hypothetical protein
VRVEKLAMHQRQCTCRPVFSELNICKPETPLFYYPENNPTARDILNILPGRNLPKHMEYA